MHIYEHLSGRERDMIFMQDLRGCTIRSIARNLKRSPSTISRELRRNKVNGYYGPITAHEAARKRLSKNQKSLTKDPILLSYVVARLKDKWSPETIAGRLHRERSDMRICAEAIYQFIYSPDGQRMNLYHYLIRKHPKRRIKCGRKPNKRGIQNAVSIAFRPAEANERKSVGHFEFDLIFFGGNQSANLISMVDRKTRFVLLAKSHSKRSCKVIGAIKNKLANLPRKAKKTGTFDRGLEFTLHEQLGIKTFFCNPHSPWQKGQVENTNGRIRRFLPNATNIKKLSEKALQVVQDVMNNQPRKCLGFQTPKEAFLNELSKTNGGYCCENFL